MGLRLFVVLVLVAAALGAAQATASSSSPAPAEGERVLFPANCRKPVYQPTRIVVACADANFVIENIRWGSWTSTRASGRGTASVNNCTPTCVAGTFETFPIRVILSSPKTCRAGQALQFVRIAITFTGQRPAGFPRVDRFLYGCGFGSS